MKEFGANLGPAVRTETRHTLQDALDELKQREQGKTDLAKMIKSTGAKISSCLGREPNAVQLDEVLDLDPQFEKYLRMRHYAETSVNTYMYLFRKIREVAQEFKPSSAGSRTREAWQKAFAALSASDISNGLGALFNWAITKDKRPATFTPLDLSSFCDYSLVIKKRSYTRVVTLRNRFPRWVLERQLGTEFPNISQISKPRYGIPIRYLPQPFRTKVERFLEWLGDPTSDNMEGNPLRPASVRIIKNFLQQLIGFLCLGAPTVEGPTFAGQEKAGLWEARGRLSALLQKRCADRSDAEIEDLVHFLLDGVVGLEQVLVEKLVRKYVKWMSKVRRAAYGSRGAMNMLCEALRKYPDKPLADIDFQWFKKVVRDLPKVSRKKVEDRKEEKWVTIEELESIADQLALQRSRCRKASQTTLALNARNELIFRLLTWLPLRRANICGCKLGYNFFKAELPKRSTQRKPDWVLERLKANPHEHFWQVHFSEDETKNKQELYCILREDLIGFFEDYIEHFQPILCKRADSGYLFPSKSGKHMPGGVYNTVRNVAFRFTGKPVNPHLIRDIAAVGVLDQSDSKTDLYTVSRLLGHRRLPTADRVYLSKFNLSHALQKIEELRDRRRSTKQAEHTDSTSTDDRMATAVSLVRQLAKVLDGIPGSGNLRSQLDKLTLDQKA